MAATKTEEILEAIADLKKTDSKEFVELCGKVETLEHTIYGNGEEGLCEMVRNVQKQITILPTKEEMTKLKEEIISSRDENGITFKWLLEKIFLPALLPLIGVVVAAAYIIQTFAK